MIEVAPGVYHWSALHPRIKVPVSSHFLAGSGTALDPLLGEQGLDPLEQLGPPQRVVLTIRHHLRDSERVAHAFGCPILCHRAGLHEFDDGPAVRGFGPGDELAPGLRALEFAAISPDDSALHVDAGPGFLAFGDGLINRGGLGYVSDGLLGDDPERIKRDLDAALEALLDQDFDGLLFAHGDPVPSGGRQALERFLQER